MSEFPGILDPFDPDDAEALRREGLKYMAPYQRFDLMRYEMDSAIILGDLSARCYEKLILPDPTQVAEWEIAVPDEYFSPYVADEDVPDFIRYCLGKGFVSEKSKLAQSGQVITDAPEPGGRVLRNSPIYRTLDGFMFKVGARNLSVNNVYKYEDNPFEAMRFCIPGRPIIGRNLIDVHEEMGNPEVAFMRKSGDFVQYRDVRKMGIHSSMIDPTSLNPIVCLALPIEQQFDYGKVGNVVDIEQLLEVPSKDRLQLDDMLGLRSAIIDHPYGIWRVIISQTVPITMPPDILGLLDTNANKAGRYGGIRHILSPLIDPKFGAHLPGGSPIRLEEEIFGVWVPPINNYVLMDCYYMKPAA